MTHSNEAQNYYNAIAENYDGLFVDSLSQAENFVVQNDLGKILRTVKRQCIKVLDLGCGTGLAWELIKNIRLPTGTIVEYYGIDISDTMIELAKKNHHSSNVHFFRSDMASLPLEVKLEKFDLILSLFGSFSHCEVAKKVVDNLMSNLLSESGTIYLMTYSQFSLRNLFSFKMRKLRFKQMYSVRNSAKEIHCPAFFYTPYKMRKLFEAYMPKYKISCSSINSFFELRLLKKLIKKLPVRFVFDILMQERDVLSLFPQLGHSLITVITKYDDTYTQKDSSDFIDVAYKIRRGRA